MSSNMETNLSDEADVGDLHQFGYVQSLRRTLGPYGSFAIAFSMISITTAIFFLLPSLFGTAGGETRMKTDFNGRTAVITGGARGIGLTVARSLAADGAKIALFDLLDNVTDAAKQIADKYGVESLGQQLDVTDRDATIAAFNAVGGRLGVPQVLVTAAGIEINNDSVNVTADEWRKVIDVNLTGTFFAAQAFGSALLQAGLPGSAILISSMSGFIVNVPQWAASYNASKAAVAHLGKSLAVEWVLAGIRVNSIAPGYVLSDLTERIIDQQPSLRDEWVARIPQGRIATPDDLSGLVSFLASDASSYLTAQTIVIDGGYTAV